MGYYKPIFTDTSISVKRINIFGLIFNQFVKIKYSDIENVKVFNSLKPDGKPTIRGTGSFFNYFPSDLAKKANQKIFLIKRKSI